MCLELQAGSPWGACICHQAHDACMAVFPLACDLVVHAEDDGKDSKGHHHVCSQTWDAPSFSWQHYGLSWHLTSSSGWNNGQF